MRKSLEDEVKWFQEGNVMMAYTDDIAKEELMELVLESTKKHLQKEKSSIE